MAPVRSRPDPRVSRLVLTLLLIPAFVGLSAGRAGAVTCSVKNLNSSTFYTDLQVAITAAAPGAALKVSGACVGNFTVAQDLRIFGIYGATLDGNGTGTTLTISAGDVKVFGVTITNGTGTDLCAPGGCVVGGGIYNQGALTLVRSSVNGNSASNLGAGIFNDAGATSTIVESRVSGNTGSFAGGGIRNLGTVVLWRSTVDGNTAQAAGAIINNGRLTITRSVVRDNVATDLFGGAIINNATLTINRSTLSGNSAPAPGGYGGAITNQIGTVSITDSVVSGNSADALGGGIMGQTDGAVILTRSAIAGNSAGFGGGIFEGGGSLSITSSKIGENSASNGGGAYAGSTATVAVSRSTIQGNTASNTGGGLFLAGGGINIEDSRVRGNSASTGGGIYGTLGSVIDISRSWVSKNAALVGIGGGVFNNGTLDLTRSSMTENTAKSAGGAMFNQSGTVAVTDSTIGGNTASSGGGLLNTGGTMNVVRSTVTANSASFNGGGIFNSDGHLTIRSSTLSANSASDPNGGGGGLYNGVDVASASTVDIANSTMSGNTAEAFGGGIINVGTVTLLSSTLSGNSAPSGGGIFNGNSGPIVGSASIAASIVAGNAGGNCSGVGTSVSNGYNLVGADCSFTAAGDHTVADYANAIGIGPLASNGGPTRTMALLPTSPAVDAIPLGIVSVDGTTFLCPFLGSTDQRGVARPQGPFCDVGAYELIPSLDVTIVDSLGVATPATTFEAPGSSGVGVAPTQLIGPQFTLAQDTVITEIGAFLNHNCLPNPCPGAAPFAVQIRPATGGTPDPSTVLATFVLSNDGDPLIVSYESVAPNLTLPSGNYFALFVPQDAIDGSLMGGASNPFNYQAELVTLGFLDPSSGTAGVSDSFAAVRVLGHPAG